MGDILTLDLEDSYLKAVSEIYWGHNYWYVKLGANSLVGVFLALSMSGSKPLRGVTLFYWSPSRYNNTTKLLANNRVYLFNHLQSSTEAISWPEIRLWLVEIMCNRAKDPEEISKPRAQYDLPDKQYMEHLLIIYMHECDITAIGQVKNTACLHLCAGLRVKPSTGYVRTL